VTWSQALVRRRAPPHERGCAHHRHGLLHRSFAHLSAINARWLLDQNGELVATLRDGRHLRIDRRDDRELLD
jgi:hypothetical protein